MHVPAVRQLVSETGLIVCQYTVRRSQYDRLTQQQLSFLFRRLLPHGWTLRLLHWI